MNENGYTTNSNEMESLGKNIISVKEKRFEDFSSCRCGLLSALDGSGGTNPTKEGGNHFRKQTPKWRYIDVLELLEPLQCTY